MYLPCLTNSTQCKSFWEYSDQSKCSQSMLSMHRNLQSSPSLMATQNPASHTYEYAMHYGHSCVSHKAQICNSKWPSHALASSHIKQFARLNMREEQENIKHPEGQSDRNESISHFTKLLLTFASITHFMFHHSLTLIKQCKDSKINPLYYGEKFASTFQEWIAGIRIGQFVTCSPVERVTRNCLA